MKSIARRARSKSPFRRRKQADELITDVIRKVVLDDSPVGYNHYSGQHSVMESVVDEESGVELVLDRQEQEQLLRRALFVRDPPSPLRINVLKPAASARNAVAVSDSHTLSTASTSVETPSRSLTSRTSMDALSPYSHSHSHSTAPGSSSRHHAATQPSKRSVFKKRFMKQQQWPSEMGNKRNGMEQAPISNDLSSSAAASPAEGGRPRGMGVRTLLCQKYKPERDEYGDNQPTRSPYPPYNPEDLSNLPAAVNGSSSSRGRESSRRVSPARLVKKTMQRRPSPSATNRRGRTRSPTARGRARGTAAQGSPPPRSRSPPDSPPDSPMDIPRIMRRLQAASVDGRGHDMEEGKHARSHDDDDSYGDDRGQHGYYNHRGGTTRTAAPSMPRSGNNRGNKSASHDIFDDPKPKSIRVDGRDSSNVSHLSIPDIMFPSEKERSMGDDSIDAVRRALSQLQQDLNNTTASSSKNGGQSVSRDAIARALMQVADTLESQEDRQALTRHVSRMSQQNQHPLWSREASEAYQRRRARRGSGTSADPDSEYGETEYDRSSSDSSLEENGKPSGGLGSPFDFLFAGFGFPGASQDDTDDEEFSEWNSRLAGQNRRNKTKKERRASQPVSKHRALLDEIDEEAYYSSIRDDRPGREQQRKQWPRLRSSSRDSAPHRRRVRHQDRAPRRKRSYSADPQVRVPRAPTPAFLYPGVTESSGPPRRALGRQPSADDSMSLGSIDSSQFKGGSSTLMAMARQYDDDGRGRVIGDGDSSLGLTGLTPIATVRTGSEGGSSHGPSSRKFHVVSELLGEPDLPWESSHYLEVGDDEFSAAGNHRTTTQNANTAPPRETRRMFF